MSSSNKNCTVDNYSNEDIKKYQDVFLPYGDIGRHHVWSSVTIGFPEQRTPVPTSRISAKFTIFLKGQYREMIF